MGTPHIFFDDFTAASGVTRMRMSTLKNGTWQVTTTPVASFFYNGLNNLNWGFRDFGTVAPGCGIVGDAISSRNFAMRSLMGLLHRDSLAGHSSPCRVVRILRPLRCPLGLECDRARLVNVGLSVARLGGLLVRSGDILMRGMRL